MSSGEIKTPFTFFRELRSAVPGERGEKWKHELFPRGLEGRESPNPASPRPEHLRSGHEDTCEPNQPRIASWRMEALRCLRA